MGVSYGASCMGHPGWRSRGGRGMISYQPSRLGTGSRLSVTFGSIITPYSVYWVLGLDGLDGAARHAGLSGRSTSYLRPSACSI
jgi:hypothetical protein